MDWKKIVNSPWVGLFCLIMLAWSLPGMEEDAVKWRKWTGNMNPHWFWLAAGVGGTLTTLWLVVKVSAHGKTILHALRWMFRNKRNVTSGDVTEIKTVSQAEYDAGTKNPTTVYLVPGQKKEGGED